MRLNQGYKAVLATNRDWNPREAGAGSGIGNPQNSGRQMDPEENRLTVVALNGLFQSANAS